MLESVIFLSFEKLGKNNKLKSTEKVNLSLKYFLWKLLSTYEGENKFCETISTLSQKFDVSNASISNFLDTLTKAEYIKKTSTENIHSTAKGAQYSYEFTAYLNKELEDVKKACNRKHSHKIQLVLSEHFYTGLEKRLYEFKSDNLIVKDFRPMQMLLVILLSLSNASGVVLNLGLKQLSTLCGLGTGKLKKHIDYLTYIGLIRRVVSGGTGHKLLGKCTSIYYLDLGHQLFIGRKSPTTLWVTKANQSLNSNKFLPKKHDPFLKEDEFRYAFGQAFSLLTNLNKFTMIYFQELLNICASKLFSQMASLSFKHKQPDISAEDLMYIALRYFVTTSLSKFYTKFTKSSHLNDIYSYNEILNLERSREIHLVIHSAYEEAKGKNDVHLKFLNHATNSNIDIDSFIDELKPLFSDVEHELFKSINYPHSNTQVENLSIISLFELIIMLEKSLDYFNKTSFDFEQINESSVFNIHKFALTKFNDVVFMIEYIHNDNGSKQPLYYLLDESEFRSQDNPREFIPIDDDKPINQKLKEKYGLVSKVDLKPVSWGSFDK